MYFYYCGHTHTRSDFTKKLSVPRRCTWHVLALPDRAFIDSISPDGIGVLRTGGKAKHSESANCYYSHSHFVVLYAYRVCAISELILCQGELEIEMRRSPPNKSCRSLARANPDQQLYVSVVPEIPLVGDDCRVLQICPATMCSKKR